MNLLVVNAGSSSLKLRILNDDDDLLHAEDLPASRGVFDTTSLRRFVMERPASIAAVGHRIVHGGTQL